MSIHKVIEMTRGMFVIREEKKNNVGFIGSMSLYFVNGFSFWTGKRFRIVIPYQFYAIISTFLIITVFIHFYLNTREISWFKSMVDLAFCFGSLNISYVVLSNVEDMKQLSLDVDKWWFYAFLDEETRKIKDNIEKKLTFIINSRIKFIDALTYAYIIAPFFKFIYRGAGNLSDLMSIDSLKTAPWIYLEILGGFLMLYISITTVKILLSYLLAIALIASAQVQLVGAAFLSIEDRVSMIIKASNLNFNNYNECTYQKLVYNEIRSCSRHYQAIYRQTKQCYEILKLLYNTAYYIGCFAFIALGVIIAKRKEGHFLIMQVSVLVVAILCIQFSLSYINDFFKDEVENLRITVYGSDWYQMTLSSKKSVQILQTMLMHCPKMRTLFGSECTIEFLGKLLNAGYCYITTILSMDFK